MLSTFLFDLDGTLIDSIELILRSYRHTMQVHRAGHPLPPDAVWMKGLGTPLWVQFRDWTQDEAEIQAMVATYREYNLAHHDAMVRPYDGVVAQVLRLQQQHKQLGLVTSKLKSGALRGLRVSGLEQAFTAVVGADDVTTPNRTPNRFSRPLRCWARAPKKPSSLATRATISSAAPPPGSKPPPSSGAPSTANTSKTSPPTTG